MRLSCALIIILLFLSNGGTVEIFKPENVPQVIQLQVGYVKNPGNNTMYASSSCTLIKANKTIIVDTMTPSATDKQKLIEALQQHDVRCEDVDYVVCTHSHTDHTGNNNLFPNSEQIVGVSSIARGTAYYTDKNIKKKDYELCPFVRVSYNPGHTPDDVSVIVQVPDIQQSLSENKFVGKVYAITGDLFFEEADIEQPQIWTSHYVDLGVPGSLERQHEYRKRTVSLADYIVPGHGPMFAVTQNHRKILQSQNISDILKLPRYDD